MKFPGKKFTDNLVVASIDSQHCRLYHFWIKDSGLSLSSSESIKYANLSELGDKFSRWVGQNNCKKTVCRWLLMRELYQTHSIDAPNVLDDELDNAIKWQIKDLLDHGVDEVLVSHYRPSHPDNRAKQVTAVVVEKQLVESLINITRESGLLMESIEIEELSIGNALIKHLSEDKIIGFVGEDDKGLVFNFYNGGELCFSRHKKGRFMPKAGEGEFVLDTDQEAQEESFLLETQRTLDYVISQIFRRPLDAILLQQESEKSEALAETIKQLTETDVILISPKVETKQENSQAPNLAEVGLALGMEA